MPRFTRAMLTASALAVCLVPTEPISAQLSFTPLGTLPGPGNLLSLAYGLSGDGSTVVGESRAEVPMGFDAAFRWTSAAGMQPITSTAPTARGYAFAVSHDGSVVVGSAAGGPYRWTQTTGLVPLPAVIGGDPGGNAYGVSASGDIVVGQGRFGQSSRAARWVGGTGQFLGQLPGWTASFASDVSDFGDVVVGSGFDSQLNFYPFRWTSGGGTTALTLLPGYTAGRATAVSADGGTTAGWCTVGGVNRAARWVLGAGVQDLGILPGQASSHVTAMTPDGATVVGMSGLRMFMWTESAGMIDLTSVLAEVIPPGWTFPGVSAISADGRTIAGSAGNPATGSPQAWVATIPAPSPFLVLLPVQLWLVARRDRS